ncbi:paraplegin-like [Gigantopelta aegis]|uniref:paraplegin-like n=1 Tax=Gigantopelta aegis TaxID=1735272 RepID=UPI001B88A71F|nr:paraplegin-like [Gigantopelta aegis]XP_041375758.1 paraplegin-like [Gigantopelta aegis]XP_041375759.1 paraplegin-like [Gigantopelta aegis]
MNQLCQVPRRSWQCLNPVVFRSATEQATCGDSMAHSACRRCCILRNLSSASHPPCAFSGHQRNLKIFSLPKTNNLVREFRAFSTLLRRSGFRSQDDLAKLFGFRQVRLFSTSDCRYNNEEDKSQEDKEKEPVNPRSIFFGLLFMIVCGYLLYADAPLKTDDQSGLYRFISWNEFYYELLAKGEVDQITVRPEIEMAIIHLHEDAVIRGKRAEFSYYTMKIPDPYRFEEKLRKAEADLHIKPEDGVPLIYHRQNNWGGVIALALFGLAIYFLIKSAPKGSLGVSSDMFASERKAKFVRVDIMSLQGKGISFKEVAGLKEAKIEIMEFVDYLKTPQRFQELGAKIPHGALLLGPPGCGKTLLARAVATEARVPFLAMAGSEFVEMLGGLGAARVRDLFKEAKKRAPCIVYVDEIDAIGRRRSGGGAGSNAEEEHTLNQLLVEMDGMGTMDGVIMLASTNRADVLDKALLRPGRFDRHIMIDLPTLIERRETFEMYLKKLKLEKDPWVYVPKLAQLTPGMSGADIANICNEAAIHAARFQKKFITGADFDYAVERVVAGVEKKTRLLSPAEKKIVAYHESGHALVGWLLKYTDALLRISIVPRTNSALGFSQYMPSDQKLYSTEELFERMCMALGGRVAEAVVFNKVTTGAQDDLEKVTKMALDQVRSYGMNEKVGHLSFPARSSETLGTKPYSKVLAATIDEEARRLVGKAYRCTEKILKDNKDKLDKLALSLLSNEVLTYDDVQKLIGPPPHGKKKTMEPHGWEGIMPSTNDKS